MKRKLILPVILSLLIGTTYAGEMRKSLFTLDLNYARIGLTNDGWGLGIGWEQLLISHLSVKSSFGHMTFKTSVSNVYCTTVNLALMANWYPLSLNMNRLYIGAGCSTDFLNYFGSATLPDKNHDTIIYFDSIIGWKQYLLHRLLIDASLGYNLIINNAKNYPNFDTYGKAGFQPAFGIKILFN